jgi:hypothetical protein
MYMCIHTHETVNNFKKLLTISFKLKPNDLYYIVEAWQELETNRG